MFKRSLYLVYTLIVCYFYYKNNFFFLSVFAHFESIFTCAIIIFLKKVSIIITILPINILIEIKPTNLNLLNGIVNIHPLIYMLIFYNLLSLYLNFLKLKCSTLFFTIVNFTALIFLGSFWAAQEISWGGWWSWDITECTILLIYIYLLYIHHWDLQNSFIELIYAFIIIFFFNKTNLINSVHSFETSFDNNYIIIIFITILVFFFLKKKNFFFFL